jgi:hypothetical protein
MSHRPHPTLKIVLITFGLWTTSSWSYPSLQGNGTVLPIGSVGHNRPVNGQAPDFKEVVPTGFSTSYNQSTSSQPSPSQSGCSYVLGYATFWPGPSVITRTDSTICPSLASTTRAHHRQACANRMQLLKCHPASTQLQLFRRATAYTKTRLLLPVVHTTTPNVMHNVLPWPPHAVLSGFSGLRGIATSPSPSRPLRSRQQQSHRRVGLIRPLLCTREKLASPLNTLLQSANHF